MTQRGLFDTPSPAEPAKPFPYGKTFDRAEGLKRKEEGINLGAEHKSDLLDRARSIAEDLARDGRGITADDVQEVLLKEHGVLLGNAAGALFKREYWEFTGEWRASSRVTNHGHQNRVWRLK